MVSLIPPSQFDLVRRFKQLYSRYQRSRDLIAVGAYAAGSDPLLDQAIQIYPALEGFLQQDLGQCALYGESVDSLSALFPDLPHP